MDEGGSRRSRLLGGGDGVRSTVVTITSTVIFFGVIGYLIVHSAGWPAFKQSFFNAEEFRVSFPLILRKFVRNIFIFLVAEVLVLSLALLLAVLRSIPGPVFAPLRFLSAAYTDVFRAVPTILVIFLLGYGMPALELQGVPESDLFWAIMALTRVYSAYVAEVYRAGIQSVHPSQTAAARSLGLSRWQSMRHVVLPQAVRRVIPPLLNDFIGLQKDSALVALLGVTEAFRQSQIITSSDGNFTPYVALALVYLVFTLPQTRFVDWMIARDRRQRQSGSDL
jgi:polar amino acid transport system permease protein